METKTVTLEDVTVEGETEKALLCEIDDESVWVPQSIIHDDSEVYKLGTSGKLIIQHWWAVRAGLTED